MRKPLLIWGCGGQGRELLFLCHKAGLEVMGFLVERSFVEKSVVDEIPVLGDITEVPDLRGRVEVLCTGVGDPSLRMRFHRKTLEAGFDFPGPIVHPSVDFAAVKLGLGTIVCEGATATVNIHVGDHVIINRAVTLGHDTSIKDFCTLSPGANISGNVSIERGVFVGTGASVREKIRIEAGAVIGGGAFVARNVAAGKLYVGVPASSWNREPGCY